MIATLVHGQPGYAGLLARIASDVEFVERMWQDAESRPAELDVPGTWWSVAVVDGQPAAWCAATVVDGVLKCHSNYERPGHRGRRLYAAAYAERHRAVVSAWTGPAVTYLFAQPIGLHEADGWVRTGVTGTSREADEPHDWWELRREPGRCRQVGLVSDSRLG